MPQDPQDPPVVADNSDEACNARARAARGLAALERAARKLAAAGIARAAEPPPEEPGLEEALDAAKRDLVLEAIDGESCHELAAQAYAVEVLERLVYPLGRPQPVDDLPADDTLAAVVDAALELARTVKSSGLQADHFEGMFNPLLGPLEALGDALSAAGYRVGEPA